MQEPEHHNGTVNFVRITSHTRLNGTRLSELTNDMSDYFKFNDVIACMVELKRHENGWRRVFSVQKIDDSHSNSKQYSVEYGHILSLKELEFQRCSGRVVTLNKGGEFDFEGYNVAIPGEQHHWSLNQKIMVGFTVKIKFSTNFGGAGWNVNKRKLVSVVPLVNFKDIEECFGTFVNIDQNNNNVVVQDNNNKFGNICLFPGAFTSNGQISNEMEKEQFHLQIIKNLPGELQEFVAVSAHLISDCESAHHSDSWAKCVKIRARSEASQSFGFTNRPISKACVSHPSSSRISAQQLQVSKMKSNASVATKQQNQSHHESQTDTLNRPFQELKLNIANPLGLPSRTLAVLKSNVVDEDSDFVGECSSTPRSSARCSPSPKSDFLEFGSNDTSSDMTDGIPNQVANIEVQTSRTNVFEQEIDRFLNLFQENVINDTETYEFLQSRCQSFLLSGMRLSHLNSSFK